MSQTRETPSPSMLLRRVCSWCGYEASVDPFGSADASTANYGICDDCVALLIASLPPAATDSD